MKVLHGEYKIGICEGQKLQKKKKEKTRKIEENREIQSKWGYNEREDKNCDLVKTIVFRFGHKELVRSIFF